MLRLRTLGGVYVADQYGELLSGAASQRRLLALLLALAVVGDRGFSRDKLIALLWPDVGEERARHSLTQALYAARRALGVDDLFVAGGDIRLNRERLASDVQELEEALETGEDERAAALYLGPFADGFFLPGSGEFEQWSSLQRTRLEDRVLGAFERLARRAEEAGQLRDALDWRKRLAAIRPLDTSAAVALMTAFAHSGDRAGALQHAQLHETLLREQFGLGPDPVVASLAARLREPVNWRAGFTVVPTTDRTTVPGPNPGGPSAGERVSALDAPEIAQDVAGGVLVSTPSPAGLGAGQWSPGLRGLRRLRGIRWAWTVAALGLAIVLGILLRREPAPPPAGRAPPSLDQRVVVAPFRVAGASSSLAYLREGMVELLSTRLADDSSARSVDAGAVLAAWRAAGLANPTDVPRGTLVRLARSLGAERVVVGGVVGTPSRVLVTAAVVEVESQHTSGEVAVEGPADSISVLVDRLAARLLALGAGEEVTLSNRTTESLRALRAFLDGQSAFRRGSYPLALRQYEEALRVDSTFALAAVQMARAADRLRGVELRTRGLALAWPERDALDARSRALLVALAGPGYPGPSEADEQIAAWERLIDLTPDRAESWFELGSRLALEGVVAGEPDAESRALAALRRALRIEPTHTPSRELLHELLKTGPGAIEQQGGEHGVAVDSALPLGPFLQWRAAIARSDSAAVRAVRDSLAQLGPRNLRSIARAAQLEGVSLGDARRAVQQLRVRATRLDDQLDATLADHALALNQGRLHDADAAIARLAELQPGAHAHLRLQVLDALYGDADSATAEAAALQLRRSAAMRAATDPRARAVKLADACVLAQWKLQRKDTTGVRQIIDWLRDEPLPRANLIPPVAAGSLACAELLRAALAVALNRPDAPRTVTRLDSLAFTVGASGDAITYAPLLIGRLHQQLGDSRGAWEAVRRREDGVGWSRYLTTAWREEGGYAMLSGTPERARAPLSHYLVLRAQPDEQLRGVIEQVQRELALVGGATP